MFKALANFNARPEMVWGAALAATSYGLSVLMSGKKVNELSEEHEDALTDTSLKKKLTGPSLAGLGAAIGYKTAIRSGYSGLVGAAVAGIFAYSGSTIGDSLTTKLDHDGVQKAAMFAGIAGAVAGGLAVRAHHPVKEILENSIKTGVLKQPYGKFVNSALVKGIKDNATVKEFVNKPRVQKVFDQTFVGGVVVGAIVHSAQVDNRERVIDYKMARELDAARELNSSMRGIKKSMMRFKASSEYNVNEFSSYINEKIRSLDNI